MKKIIIILTLVLYAFQISAQDPHFSQYYASPLYLNPGLTGASQHPRLMLNSRIQWTKLPQAFTTYAVSADIYIEKYHSGFGLMALTDKEGSVNLRNTTVTAFYSAKIRLSPKWILSPGLSFGYGNRTIDYDKMLFGDQILFNGPTSDDAIQTLGNTSYFDFSSGAVIYNKNFWAGFSAYHINEPNHSLLGEMSKLPMRMSFHAGGRIPISHNILSTSKLSSVSPSFVFTKQGDFKQFDFGANVVFDPVLVGLWYRGIPLMKTEYEKFSQDAIIFIIGLNLKYLEVNYSYDITISHIGPDTGGSHEISILLPLKNLDLTRGKKYDKFLPCPNDSGFEWRH